MQRLFTVCCLLVLTACATPPMDFHVQSPFNPAVAARMLADGTNTIKGSAVMRQRGGGVVTCAGGVVTLVPATDYAIERMSAIYGGANIITRRHNRTFIPDPPEYDTMVKTTHCDAQGFFKFERLADGDFFVITVVAWQVQRYQVEGGALMRRVAVQGGRTAEIVLTP